MDGWMSMPDKKPSLMRWGWVWVCISWHCTCSVSHVYIYIYIYIYIHKREREKKKKKKDKDNSLKKKKAHSYYTHKDYKVLLVGWHNEGRLLPKEKLFPLPLRTPSERSPLP